MFNFLFNKSHKYTNYDNKKNNKINDKIEIEQNICSNESDTSTCMYYDMNSNMYKRDYMVDFINYEICNNIKSTLSIIINNNVSNIFKCNTKTYYNKILDHYYYECNEKISFNEIKGNMEFIIKTNNNILATIKFNYKLNKPMFNSDIIKIHFKKNIIYLFVRRHSLEEKFYIYKIIYTNSI